MRGEVMQASLTSAEALGAYLDEYLRTAEVRDHPNAFNGLQVTREGPISRIALAVDASQQTIDAARNQGADLLIVHHGLFWEGAQPLTGRRYRRVRSLIESNLGLYASHLPLDLHPEIGNNIVLARELGIEVEGSFGESGGVDIGVHGRLSLRREALAARLDQVLGCRIRMIAGGPERVERVGVITGGAGRYVEEARRAGLHAFITGEGSHANYFDAVEGGVNLYFGGHYATEVWGVRALARHLSESLGADCFFIDAPTGL